MIPAHCYNALPQSFVGDRCFLKVSEYKGCDNRRALHRVAVHPMAVPIYTLSTCVCNEWLGLKKRHLVELYKPANKYMKHAWKTLLRIRRYTHGVVAMTPMELYRTRSTHVKKRWRRAINDPTPVQRKDSFVKAFVKYEKYQLIGKPPRMIQAPGS